MIIAPAMNCNMWNNSAVQENLSILRNRGVEILDTDIGFWLADIMEKVVYVR